MSNKSWFDPERRPAAHGGRDSTDTGGSACSPRRDLHKRGAEGVNGPLGVSVRALDRDIRRALSVREWDHGRGPSDPNRRASR